MPQPPPSAAEAPAKPQLESPTGPSPNRRIVPADLHHARRDVSALRQQLADGVTRMTDSFERSAGAGTITRAEYMQVLEALEQLASEGGRLLLGLDVTIARALDRAR